MTRWSSRQVDPHPVMPGPPYTRAATSRAGCSNPDAEQSGRPGVRRRPTLALTQGVATTERIRPGTRPPPQGQLSPAVDTQGRRPCRCLPVPSRVSLPLARTCDLVWLARHREPGRRRAPEEVPPSPDPVDPTSAVELWTSYGQVVDTTSRGPMPDVEQLPQPLGRVAAHRRIPCRATRPPGRTPACSSARCSVTCRPRWSPPSGSPAWWRTGSR
jgi:hypothetical protein